MPTMTCPNCGFQQAGGDKCQKCSTLFAYYSMSGAMSPSMKAAASTPGARVAPDGPSPGGPVTKEKPATKLLRRAYRVTHILTLASLIVAVFLVVHRAPRPAAAIDPNATAHVERKLQELATAQEAGTPHELRLDEAELNSYLASNLDLKRDNQGASAPQVPAAPSTPAQDALQDGSLAAGAPGDASAVAEPSYEEVRSSVKDVQMTMDDDRVQAYVVFDFHGEDLSLTVDGRLHVQDGYLRFEPVAGKLGSLPLPQSTLESAVQRLFDSPENKERFRVPPDVKDIRIEDGQLVVAYK